MTWLFWLLLLLAPALGQDIREHPPEHMELHERFYSTWMIPPGRTTSCCNRRDCYPATVKRVGGIWFVQIRETGQWVVIPVSRIEQNQADPRESPDYRPHVCASATGMVHCFTFGEGL